MTESVSSTRAARLKSAAAEAAEVRTAQQSPHVRALTIERQRTIFNLVIWTAVVIGLSYTASNVQQFAAHGAPVGSLTWWFAWGLDPTVALPLVAVLLVDQIISSHGGRIPTAGLAVKWGALTMTYLMNTWSAWSDLNARLVLLHSVPVVGVFLVVSAAPRLRNALTSTIERVAAEPDRTAEVQQSPVPSPVLPTPVIADPLPSTLPVRPSAKAAPAEPYPARHAAAEAPSWAGLEDVKDAGREVSRKLNGNLSRNKLLAEFRGNNISISTDRANKLVAVLKHERDQRSLHVVGGA